ncbi:MAG: stage 0 sporulation family protein [Syntrophaceae bacterium]
MRHIVGVRAEKEGRVLNFQTSDETLKKSDAVIVNAENGPSVGIVATDSKAVPLHMLPTDIRSIIRRCTDEDLRTLAQNQKLERDARGFCFGRIRERGLPMKLIGVECLFDRSKLIFFFTADNRVDFRELVKDLVQKFKTRIELRQIGARNESRIFGGLGVCGQKICCTNFLYNLDRVSVKMAKEQNMPLNPEKISGLCGRLMCCLAFEYDSYLDMKRGMPKCGKRVGIAQGGCGKVIRQNILKGTLAVYTEEGKEVEVEIKDLREPQPLPAPAAEGPPPRGPRNGGRGQR